MDDKEAAPNKNSGTDALDFDSALLGGLYITDEEGAAPNENLLTAIDDLVEAITAGVFATNGPKGKTACGADEAFY